VSILNRLEGVYLNILRVVILLLATALLLATVVAAVFVTPKFLPQGKGEDARSLVQNDGLADFKRAQRGEPAERPTAGAEESKAEDAKIDARLQAAAKALAQRITADGGAPNVAAIEDFLVTKQASLTETLQGDYADSVKRLAIEAAAAKPNSVDVPALIDWHFSQFEAAQERANADAHAKEVEKAERNQLALVAAAAAAAAFGLFLFLIFVFVLVKIERNLRVVSVAIVKVPGSAADQSA